MPKLPEHPKKREPVYAEYDEEYGTWAVFGLDSGFCYAQPWNREEAEAMAEEMNQSLPTELQL